MPDKTKPLSLVRGFLMKCDLVVETPHIRPLYDSHLTLGAAVFRCHSARDHPPPVRDNGPQIIPECCVSKIICDTELGGRLKSYRRLAKRSTIEDLLSDLIATCCANFDFAHHPNLICRYRVMFGHKFDPFWFQLDQKNQIILRSNDVATYLYRADSCYS